MKRPLPYIATLCSGIVAMMLAAAPASAQATRTWVSGVGDDANPCSRTAPCKTFAGAISKTASGGEINVLDPGGFGGVTITKSITISSVGFEAGVLVSGTNAIIVNAGVNDRVVLQGLDIEGLGTGLNGVNFLGGSQLYIIDCHIRHFTGNAVNMAAGGGGHVFINRSFLLFNTGGVSVTGANNVATITDTEIYSNTTFGVQVNTAGGIITVEKSNINNNPAGIAIGASGGQVISIGTSNFVNGTGAFTATAPLK